MFDYFEVWYDKLSFKSAAFFLIRVVKLSVTAKRTIAWGDCGWPKVFETAVHITLTDSDWEDIHWASLFVGLFIAGYVARQSNYIWNSY